MKSIQLKYIVLLIAMLACQAISKSSFAQAPQKLGYQLLVQNNKNQPIVNQKVGVQISILKNSPTGVALYTETLEPTTNESGLVSIEIGTGNAIMGSFSEIDWSVGPYFIKTETDPTGGANYTITGTSQLLSVPYALFSKTAENVLSFNYDDLINKPIGITNGDILYWNGAGWSVLPIGKPGQILRVSDQNLPEWTDNASNSNISADGSNPLKAATTFYLPNVSIDGVFTAVTSTSANMAGYIISEGGTPVTDKGVCWSTSMYPTISGSFYSNGSGGGSFTGSMTGLTPGTLYYVRTYATNSVGTAYSSSQCSFPYPVVATTSILNIYGTSASSGGYISYSGSSNIISRGVCWSNSANPTVTSSKTNDGTGIGSFSSSITGLTIGVTYHVRAYATNSSGTSYGNDLSFTTSNPTLPILSNGSITNINAISAATSTYVVSDGFSPITASGVCWNTAPNPLWFFYHTTDGTGTGTYSSALTALTPNTLYYVRSYAINSAGFVGYSGGRTFTTAQLNYATITTTTASSIICNSAVSGGNVTNEGGAPVTDRGLCWGLSLNPSIGDSHGSFGTASGTGSFQLTISGLTPGTTYHVRAYALNAKGYSYGNDIAFTSKAITVPTLTTTTVSSITATTALSGGIITDDGCSIIISKGVVWGTNPYPPWSGTNEGTGSGPFTSTLTALTVGQTYYVKAYAQNSAGIGYGTSFTFSTKLPTVTTTAATSITSNSALLGGNVTSIGGTAVTERGIFYGTTNPPTIKKICSISGDGSGTYPYALSGLSPNTTYYVYAYATNSIGTSVGSTISFTTSNVTLPVVTTTAPTSINSTGATLGGTITNYAGNGITACGFYWSSTNPNPTAADHVVYASIGTPFTFSMTGLTLGTTIYVRAFATNSVGPGPGLVVSFTTVLAIGDDYQDGKIAHLYKDSNGADHGFVVAILSNTYPWDFYNKTDIALGASNTDLMQAKSNTDKIVAYYGTSDGTGYAAEMCASYTVSAFYKEWYLPTIAELIKICQNKAILGDFGTGGYWSSTEGSSSDATSFAYYVSFNDCTQATNYKLTNYSICAIHYF